jgi:hypothetical protein
VWLDLEVHFGVFSQDKFLGKRILGHMIEIFEGLEAISLYFSLVGIQLFTSNKK